MGTNVGLEEFSKAIESLQKGLTVPKSDLSRDVSSQRFEFWRNLSSQTYKEELADEVYEFAKEFLPSAMDLLQRLRVS